MRMTRPVLIMLAAALSAVAQSIQTTDQHFIRASAEAVVTGKPDRAQISIGVQTEAPTAKAAAEQNATQTAAVIGKLKGILAANGQIQTSNYSISPHYEMNNGTSRENGFETRNSVAVTVDDLSILPQLLDAATSAGANNVGGISFSMRDDTALRAQALAEASRKARTAAESIAQALDLQVIGVASAESGFGPGPVRPLPLMGRAVNMATPIEAGSLEVHATVTVTLAVSSEAGGAK